MAAEARPDEVGGVDAGPVPADVLEHRQAADHLTGMLLGGGAEGADKAPAKQKEINQRISMENTCCVRSLRGRRKIMKLLLKFKRQAKTASRQREKRSKKQLHEEGEAYLLAWFPVPEVVCSPGNPRRRLGLR